jgi:ABC-type Fe3+ transport system substrate-binding protein
MTRLAVLLMSAMLAPCALAQSSDWQKTWNETLAAAKKEGKVVIVGSPDPVMRNEVIPAFTKRYGIAVDYLAGKSGTLVERAKIERSSGLYAVDAFLAGSDTQFNVLLPEKMIDPLRPMLILPEVTDPSKWKIGKLWFMDPEEQYILRLFNSVGGSQLFINTDHVKPEEITSAQDLLNPKWKNKISSEDPTADSGTGGNLAADLYKQLGPDYVKKLYMGQNVAFSRDRRQFTDWLARGTYPICLSCRSADVRPMQQEGFKILEIRELKDVTKHVNAAPFLTSVANKAAHPNAIRIFLNWLAGPEALKIYSRGHDSATLRTDVDESFLDPSVIPRPGVQYADDAEPYWRSVEKPEIGKKLLPIFKGQ